MPTASQIPPNDQERIRQNVARMRERGATDEQVRRYLTDYEQLTPSQPAVGVGEGMARAVGQGLTFSLGDELEGAARGAYRAATTPQTFGAAYDAAVGEVRGRMNTFRDEHPALSAVSEVAGGLAVPGAALYKIGKGASLAARAGAAAVGGAASGAAGGFGAAEGGLRERSEGLVRGTAVGAIAAPVLGTAGARLVRAGGSAVRALRGGHAAEEAADEMIFHALQRDGLSPEDAVQRLQSWRAAGAKPETLLEIGGDNVRGLARASRATPGRAKQEVPAALDGRHAGAEERVVDDALTSAGGRRANPWATVDELITQRADEAKPLYERAYVGADGAERAIDDPEIHTLIDLPQFREAYNRARRLAQIEGVKLPTLWRTVERPGRTLDAAGQPVMVRARERAEVPSVRALDWMKRGLDDVIDGRMRGGTMGRTEARGLRQRLNQALERIDDAVPEYRQARSAFRGRSEVIDAYEMGAKHFTEPPDKVTHAFAGMSEAEKVAYRRRALESFFQRVEAADPSRNVADQISRRTVDQKRLRLLFGDDAAYQRFLALVRREADMGRSRSHVLGNSATADKLAELAALADDVPMEAVVEAATGNWRGLARRVGVERLAALRRGVTSDRASALAPRLTAGSDGNQAGLDAVLAGVFDARSRLTGRALDARRQNTAAASVTAAGLGSTVAPRERRDRERR